jgi:hypothetical protein
LTAAIFGGVFNVNEGAFFAGAFFAGAFFAAAFFGTTFFGAGFFAAAFFAGAFFAGFAAFFAFFVMVLGFFEVFFAVFFVLATPCLLLARTAPGDPNHTIGQLEIGKGPRITITPRAGGLTVMIPPLAQDRGWRRRLAAIALAVAAAALLGAWRLGLAWNSGMRRGDFGDLPMPVLVFLSLAVLVSAPLALVGLTALAFAEERIEVGPEGVTIRTTAFEKTKTTVIASDALDCWRETYWPLSPWWTWAVKRLAASSGGHLHPIAGAAGPAEKRALGEALAAATGKPLVGDRGRVIPVERRQ